MRIFKIFPLIVLLLMLTACASKQDTPPSPVPAAEASATSEPKPETRKEEKQTLKAHDIGYTEDGTGQYITVSEPVAASARSHKNDPQALGDILDMEGMQEQKQESAVLQMRPKAIKEAAQLVTFQKAIAHRYKELLAATEKHGAIMDTAFNFAPLLMTHGDALIMPPVLAKAGASIRIEGSAEHSETVTTAKTTYELLAPAKYIAAAPNWRTFLMVGAFPEAEEPHPAVLPQNAEERAIWREAVREAWAQGQSEADRLYADNVANMVRTYRGVMLYHLLTAQHLLSRVDTASADLGLHTTDNGNKLHIGQKVYRITAPSRFNTSGAKQGEK